MRSIPENPGIHRDVLEPDERRFTKLIPEGYNGENQEPLILALHWGGPKWPFIGESLMGELVEPALEELGAIIVAPDLTSDDWNSPCGEVYVHRVAASLLTCPYLKRAAPRAHKRRLINAGMSFRLCLVMCTKKD